MGYGFIVFCIIIIVAFFGIMIIVFTDKNNKTQSDKKPTRRYIKDVKPGEYIVVEWDRMVEKMGSMKCINNDPQTKKILLEVKWGNYKEVKGTKEYEKRIFDYDGIELKNFHLLNQLELPSHTKQEDDDIDDYDIITLQKKMNEAIEKQEYEEADKLQKKIDKLSKKNK